MHYLESARHVETARHLLTTVYPLTQEKKLILHIFLEAARALQKLERREDEEIQEIVTTLKRYEKSPLIFRKGKKIIIYEDAGTAIILTLENAMRALYLAECQIREKENYKNSKNVPNNPRESF